MKQIQSNPYAQKIAFHVISLFPETVKAYTEESILKRAQETGIIDVLFYNPRSFVKPTGNQKNKEKPYLRIDDKPYGGGPGMVIQALPVIKAIEKIHTVIEKIEKKDEIQRQAFLAQLMKKSQRILAFGSKEEMQEMTQKIKLVSAKKVKRKPCIVFLSPSGEQFTNEVARRCVKKYTDIIIICGRYEGIDARVKKVFKTVDISVGPFVTTGGEVPAMILVDVMSRQIDGVLGNNKSREELRVSSSDVYTRPEVLEYKNKKYRVPKVLLEGNHAKIEEWRQGKKTKTN